MKEVTDKFNHVCATCDYYECQGRKHKGSGIVEFDNAQGKCYAVDTVNGWTRSWGATCGNYEPWGPLKKV